MKGRHRRDDGTTIRFHENAAVCAPTHRLHCALLLRRLPSPRTAARLACPPRVTAHARACQVLLKRDLSGPIATRVLGPVARELRQVSAALPAASPLLASLPPHSSLRPPTPPRPISHSSLPTAALAAAPLLTSLPAAPRPGKVHEGCNDGEQNGVSCRRLSRPRIFEEG